MKTILSVLFILGLTSAANAWQRFPIYPRVGGVEINKLCDAGSSFRTTRAVEMCTEWEGHVETGELYRGNEWTCVSSSHRMARISKNYEARTCVDKRSYDYRDHTGPVACARFAKSIKRHGRTFEVPVYEDKGELGLVQVDSFAYTIPRCR